MMPVGIRGENISANRGMFQMLELIVDRTPADELMVLVADGNTFYRTCKVILTHFCDVKISMHGN